MLSFIGDYCGTQLSVAPTGVLLTELPSFFCTLFGLNTMATTPKFSLPSIIRLQHASMDATSHLAATTKSQQVLKFSSSMEGCTTWIEKWGRQEFLEDDGFRITSGSNVWEGAVVTVNEDVVRLQFDDDNIPNGEYDITYIPNMLPDEWILEALNEKRASLHFLDTMATGFGDIAQSPVPPDILPLVASRLHLEPSQAAAFNTSMSERFSSITGAAGCGKSHVAMAIMEARFLAGHCTLVTGPTNALVDALCTSWAEKSRLTAPAVVRLYSKVQRATGNINHKLCAHALAKTLRCTVQDVLSDAMFVFTTNALSLSPKLQALFFHHHIVDEASRTNLPQSVALTTCAQNTTFLGDPLQLPPHTHLRSDMALPLRITKDDIAQLVDLAQVSGLDVCRAGIIPHTIITEQHRMTEVLTNFVSTVFCGHMIGHAPETATAPMPGDTSIHLVDTSIDQKHTPVNEMFNLTCATFTPRVPTSSFCTKSTRYVQDILAWGQDRWKGKSIAILANHFEQNRLNKAVFGSHPGVAHIDTVGRFQGKQADIVILTLASENPGFFATNARQYEACSRARHGLFIVGEIGKWKDRQQVKHLMDALAAVATGQPIPLTRVHTAQELPRFTADAPPHSTTDWVICTWMPMDKVFLQTTLLQPHILAPIQSDLANRLGCPVPATLGRFLHPDCTWIFTNILAFPVPAHLQGFPFQEALDPVIYGNVQCRPLHAWELELFTDVPRKMRSALTRGNKRYTLTLGLFQALYPAMLTHCQHMAMGASLMTFLYGLVPHTATCNTFTQQHGTQITPTLCTWCHAHSSITTSIEQNLVNYNSHSHSQYIPLLNSFTMDITPDTIFNDPVKVATGNGLAWHDLATRSTPLTKWQMNASQKIFKGGGDTLPLHAGIADMFTALHLHDGNAIWRNVFNNYNAAAGRHIDDCRFKRSATYIFHFGPPCIMQWDGKEYELLHNTLYGFDASMPHELPCCGR